MLPIILIGLGAVSLTETAYSSFFLVRLRMKKKSKKECSLLTRNLPMKTQESALLYYSTYCAVNLIS
jgi:hypothetical protein